jgi:hypothetical protein
MTREQIIKMAREADCTHVNLTGDRAKAMERLERFAALVAAAAKAEEREACAKVCEDRITAYRYATDAWAQEHIDEARHLAAAIRARGRA